MRRITRRQVLAGTGSALALGSYGCVTTGLPSKEPSLVLPRLEVDAARISAITVCTRPFRATGPRLEVERLGEKTIVHNYGHGGSGWSLSWGSGAIARARALETGVRDIAVIGCGAIGLTTGVLLQQAGARVTIYAKELPPDTRSSLATGVWSPDSRICMASEATADFKKTWETMARFSYHRYQSLLGLPGEPVEYFEQYQVREPGTGPRAGSPDDGRPPFAKLAGELIDDLGPSSQTYPAGTHSLGPRTLVRQPSLMFNLAAYTRLLLSDFVSAGGRVEQAEFRTPQDLARLSQRTLVNATGYGARALFSDDSVVPVRGQLARTPPIEGIHYGVFHRRTVFVPRRDGFVFQVLGPNDYVGFGDETTVPDRAEAERAVTTIAELFA